MKVTKFIPATSEDQLLPGEYFAHDEDSTGANIYNGITGFSLNTSISYGYYEAYTWVKRIAYDAAGGTVNVYFPVSPGKLKWKYFKTKRIW